MSDWQWLALVVLALVGCVAAWCLLRVGDVLLDELDHYTEEPYK